jgi:hypothetical protein
MIHDLAEGIPSVIPLKPYDDLWPIPEAAWWQSGDFYRNFARVYEDIACDIEDGQEPDPHNMAEEIALHPVFDAAAGIIADESLSWSFSQAGCPSRASTSTCFMCPPPGRSLSRPPTSATAALRA